MTLLLPVLMLTASACAGWFSRPATDLKEATAEQLTTLLREREGAVQTLKGLFRAQIQGPGIPITQRLEGALFYRRPDAVRLQGFNRLGGELFEFVVARDVYRLRLPGGQVYAGSVQEVDRIGKIGKPFKLSMLAISGPVGIESVAGETKVLLAEEGDRYRMDVFPDAGTSGAAGHPARRLWFERRTFHVVQEDRLGLNGEIEASARFEDFRPIGTAATPQAEQVLGAASAVTHDGGVLRPFRVTVEDRKTGGMLVLMFQEMIPNVQLKPEELRMAMIDGEGPRLW